MTDVRACQALLDRLASSASVEAKEIYKHLSHEDTLSLKQRFAELREQRKWYEEARKELSEYTRLLRIADLIDGRAESLSYSSDRRRLAKIGIQKTVKVSGPQRLREKAETKYEDALERLSELLHGRDDLAIFFDRNCSWGTSPGHETVSPDKDGMPRFAFPFGTFDQIKIEVLREAIEKTSGRLQVEANTQADQQKLKSMLKALRK